MVRKYKTFCERCGGETRASPTNRFKLIDWCSRCLKEVEAEKKRKGQ